MNSNSLSKQPHTPTVLVPVFIQVNSRADEQTLWGLSKYSHFTKTNKDLAQKFKAILHLPHKPTEKEKSEEVRENAEKEERDHQERMRKVHEVEREPSREGKEEKVREALFGDDGLEKGEEGGELTEERVREAVDEKEEREKTRDQSGVGIA
jgi:hypothetical protein